MNLFAQPSKKSEWSAMPEEIKVIILQAALKETGHGKKHKGCTSLPSVSREWFRLTVPMLWKSISVTLSTNEGRRPLHMARVSGKHFDGKLCPRYKPYVSRLRVDCDFHPDVFNSYYHVNLKDFTHPFCNLRELHIRMYTDDKFCILMDQVPSLRCLQTFILKVEGNPMVKNQQWTDAEGSKMNEPAPSTLTHFSLQLEYMGDMQVFNVLKFIYTMLPSLNDLILSSCGLFFLNWFLKVMTGLRVLDLMSGIDLDEIIPWIGLLKTLKALRIYSNEYSAGEIKTILKKLPDIELFLGSNGFQCNQDLFSCFKHLRHFSLNYSPANNNLFPTNNVMVFQNLQSLELQALNFLPNQFLKDWIENYTSMPNLGSIKIRDCRLFQKDTIFEFVKKFGKNLSKLRLENTGLTEEMVKPFLGKGCACCIW